MRAPSVTSPYNVVTTSTGEMPETDVILQAVRDGDYATDGVRPEPYEH